MQYEQEAGLGVKQRIIAHKSISLRHADIHRDRELKVRKGKLIISLDIALLLSLSRGSPSPASSLSL